MNAKERVAQKVESNSKKPHMAAGELTPSERKFEAENTAEKMEVSDDNNHLKAVVQSDEVELKRKEMEKSSERCKRRFRRLSSERGDYEGAKYAKVAKAMCQARLDTVNVETAA